MTLHDLGLSAELEQVYRLAVTMPRADLDRIATALGLDVAAAEPLVHSLAGLGLLRVDGRRLTVIDPTSAVGGLIERTEDELIERYRRTSATRSELGDLAALHAAAIADEDVTETSVERIEDMTALRDKIEELSFFTRDSLSTMVPGKAPSPEVREAARPLDRRALRRGIRMRVIRETPVLEDEGFHAYLLELVAVGAEIRIAAEGDAHRMLIMDRRVSIVPIDRHDSSRGALIVRHPVLLAGFEDLFERTWARSTPVQDVDGGVRPGERGTSELDRSVLRMMASGTTDDAAARELSISVRHLRRHISRILGDLSAPSRFAAGAEAARRGLI